MAYVMLSVKFKGNAIDFTSDFRHTTTSYIRTTRRIAMLPNSQ